jgi:hypothetical protein
MLAHIRQLKAQSNEGEVGCHGLLRGGGSEHVNPWPHQILNSRDVRRLKSSVEAAVEYGGIRQRWPSGGAASVGLRFSYVVSMCE